MKNQNFKKKSKNQKGLKKIIFTFVGIIVLILLLVGTYNVYKPLPDGVSIDGAEYKSSEIKFLTDLTYEKNGTMVYEQTIFNEVYRVIRDAQEFVIVDMFLFNDDYEKKNKSFRPLSKELTNALIEKKRAIPNMKIYFITDEINTFYGAYNSKFVEELKKNKIEVIFTNMTRMRDSNPAYSSIWRCFIQWFGTSVGSGWIENPFSKESPKVTVRSMLRLSNFKANHRKVVVTEREAMVMSANPHDESANHSNAGVLLTGEIINDIVDGEKAVAEFSGKNIDINNSAIKGKLDGSYDVSYITEGKIGEKVDEVISKCTKDDSIMIAMFYLADRKVVKDILDASRRGVDIRIVLDQNLTAFGRTKNGVPNKCVAGELVEKSNKAIKIRWYNTHGEEYHNKMVVVRHKNNTEIVMGSGNMTRRNIRDFNVEADVYIKAPNSTKLSMDITKYFDKIWFNQDGNFTIDFNNFYEKDFMKDVIYRFQEWTGLSTF